MKEKIFKKGLCKRMLSLAVALAMMITLMPSTAIEVKAADWNELKVTLNSVTYDSDKIIGINITAILPAWDGISYGRVGAQTQQILEADYTYDSVKKEIKHTKKFRNDVLSNPHTYENFDNIPLNSDNLYNIVAFSDKDLKIFNVSPHYDINNEEITFATPLDKTKVYYLYLYTHKNGGCDCKATRPCVYPDAYFGKMAVNADGSVTLTDWNNRTSTIDKPDSTGTTVAGGEKKVTVSGMKDNQEYIVSTKAHASELTAADWSKTVDSTKGEMDGLTDGTTYYVYTRIKNDTHSGVALVGSCITDLKDNKKGYTVDKDGIITIDKDYEVFSNESCTTALQSGAPLTQGVTYYVRKKGQGGAAPSNAVLFEYQPLDAPVTDDFHTEAPTFVNGDDGKITGVDETMQYSIDDGPWQDVEEGKDTIEGLSGGQLVRIRKKGEDPNNAGVAIEITVPNGKLPASLKSVTVEGVPGEGGTEGGVDGEAPNPEKEPSTYRVNGITPDMQYRVNGGEWIEGSKLHPEGGVLKDLPSGTVVEVRVKPIDENDPNASKILKLIAGKINTPAPSHSGGGCSNGQHQYEWGNWDPVTKEQNGIRVYQCKLCGYLLEKEYIPAYAYTCLTESEHVLKTPQNGSVICEMGRWNAYPRWFFEKLATRPDVNITLKFLYQNKQYTVSIPAGTKIDTECDWYGPMKICSLYQFEVK